MPDLILLFIALAGLWVGSELVINAARAIARHYRVSDLFIGLTLVAFGTDLPELFIDITAAFQRLNGIETSGLIIGQTIGSSFGQIALVLGIVALAGTISIRKKRLYRDGLMMIIAVVLVFLLGLDGMLSQIDGLILVASYIFYIATIFREERALNGVRKIPMDRLWSFVSIISGFAILIYASQLTVTSALSISEHFGISQSLIGLFIVGLGTSLPELATSLNAVRRNAGQLAIGNLIGSTTFDLLLTLGIGSAISGFLVSRDILIFDMPALFVVSLLVIGLFAMKGKLNKKEALLLIGVYILYFILKVFIVF
ncbi:hypothetical protein COB64_02175 [Candidatus Wolfebacteria bacterium]|nr:MAG: hypothetical protein COB64_02175 [Candidatus Wolfebacteria bacterium]